MGTGGTGGSLDPSDAGAGTHAQLQFAPVTGIRTHLRTSGIALAVHRGAAGEIATFLSHYVDQLAWTLDSRSSAPAITCFVMHY